MIHDTIHIYFVPLKISAADVGTGFFFLFFFATLSPHSSCSATEEKEHPNRQTLTMHTDYTSVNLDFLCALIVGLTLSGKEKSLNLHWSLLLQVCLLCR